MTTEHLKYTSNVFEGSIMPTAVLKNSFWAEFVIWVRKFVYKVNMSIKILNTENTEVKKKYNSNGLFGPAAARPMGGGPDDCDEAWTNQSRQPLC